MSIAASCASASSEGRTRASTRVELAEIELGLGIEHVARQADEHRSGRRGQRQLGRAAHDARQVFGARDLDRPFDHGLGDRQQRVVEQRLEQAVALLLLARGHDQRRTGELRVVERAYRIAQARGDMQAAGGEPAGGARVTVGHRHHHGFLQHRAHS